jgi:predicted nucleic acid-binding protein
VDTPQVGRRDSGRLKYSDVSRRQSRPHKTDAQRILERLVIRQERLVTDAEVLQEILHRYSAINRRQDIQIAFDAVLRVVDEVLPVDRSAAERAKQNERSRSSCPTIDCRPAMVCMSQ